MSLELLKQFAVKSNNTAAAKPKALHELPTEELRKRVKIKDGNRKPSQDGSVALVLTLGKKNLSLDALVPEATRVNASVENRASFEAALQEQITLGTFDAEITKIALESLPAVIEPMSAAEQGVAVGYNAGNVVGQDIAVAVAPSGVDLDELG